MALLRRMARTQAVRRTVVPLAARLLSVRRWTVRRGEAAGLRIAIGGSNPAYVFGLSEPHVQRAIAEALAPGGIFFDVGANIGFFTLIGARAAGATGHVYAFEPNPSARAVLEQNIAENGFADRVTPLPWALGETTGSERLLRRSISRARIAPEGDLRVEVRPLDAQGLPPPDVVKIDVEGEEEAVIRGMRDILTRDQPLLIVETHDEPSPVVELLAALGYSSDRPEGVGMPHLIARPGRTATSTAE